MGSKGIVLIVDDDSRVLDSLERLLRLNGYSVQTFSSPGSIINYRIPEDPCCAILDIQMPGSNGVEVQSWLARTHPEMPVILMTGYGDIPQAVRAIRAGAADFLTKPVEERRLLSAVKRAFTQGQRRRVEEEARATYEKRFASLTPREKQVCALVVEGKLNKQIAAELGTCEKTVKVHRGRVMRKMKVESVAELVRVILGLDGGDAAWEAKNPIFGPAASRGKVQRDVRPRTCG